jgi:putative addiction module killer protein
MELVTYETESGRTPFREWYLGLDTTVVARVSHAIERLRQGNFGNTKGVGSGVFEFRIDYRPGYRIYFGRDGQESILLLTGGGKRRQQRNIDAAISFWDEYRRKKRGM